MDAPRGLSRCDDDARLRWELDEWCQSPYQYLLQNYVISELVAMRTQMDAFIIASRDYHYSRAEGVGKLFAGNKSDESTSESSEVADGKVETETAAITPTHTLMHTNPRFCSSLPLAFRSFRSHRPRR